MLLIIIYVIGSSIADYLSEKAGMIKSLSLVFQAGPLVIILLFIKIIGLEIITGSVSPGIPQPSFCSLFLLQS